MDKNNSSKTWIAGLDTIRFFLAFIVVLSHSNIVGPLKLYFISNGYVRGILALIGHPPGIAAVIAFFIISGIVIHFPYRKGRDINLKEFYAKRFLRILIPMAIIAIVAYFLKIDESSLPFWSLYCELIYYTLYPLIYWLLFKKGITIHLLIIAAFVFSYIFLIFEWTDIEIFIHQKQRFATYFHHFGVKFTWLLGLPCWLLGVLIAINYDKYVLSTVSLKAIYFYRICVYLTAIMLDLLYANLGLSQTLTMGIYSILVAYWISKEIGFWSTRPVIILFEKWGKWSYSLYLCHMIVIVVAVKFGAGVSFFVTLIQIPIILLISYIYYLLIEKPSHKLLKQIKISN